MNIAGNPYTILISVLIGVTNIIPFFGQYIGIIPSAVLVFIASPSKGVLFLILIIILMQFDGNVLGPKILGDSIGLKSFWIFICHFILWLFVWNFRYDLCSSGVCRYLPHGETVLCRTACEKAIADGDRMLLQGMG